jgi:hypothetical protein
MDNYTILISIAILIFILSLSFIIIFNIPRSEMQKVKKKNIYKEYEEPIITYPSNNNNTFK